METTLHNTCMSVLDVKNRDELHAELLRFTQALGFDFFSALAIVDRSHGESDFHDRQRAPSVPTAH